MIFQGSVKSYALGFIFSLAITLISFYLASEHLLSKWPLIFLIAGLAVIQAWAFLYLYLGLGKETKPHWNMTVFLFMIMVTVILVAGTIWIMYHLNYNLMMKH